MKFLYAAYGVTWAVHIIYLVILTRGFRPPARRHQGLGTRLKSAPRW